MAPSALKCYWLRMLWVAGNRLRDWEWLIKKSYCSHIRTGLWIDNCCHWRRGSVRSVMSTVYSSLALPFMIWRWLQKFIALNPHTVAFEHWKQTSYAPMSSRRSCLVSLPSCLPRASVPCRFHYFFILFQVSTFEVYYLRNILRYNIKI